jgi:FG-GAP-like repeat/ASPIC and UnbV
MAMNFGTLRAFAMAFFHRAIALAPRIGLFVFVALAGIAALRSVVGHISLAHAEDIYQAPSTKRMAALLAKIFREQDWKTDSYTEDERAEYYRSLLDRHPDLSTEIQIRQTLGETLLRAGDSGRAIEQFETIRKVCAQRNLKLDRDAEHRLRDALAISYLRLGEQQNCLLIHGREACIFPIHGSGIHARQEGAEGAFRELSAALEDNPKDLKLRWLLNIAAMTLGRYPSAVPQKLLVPLDRFKSDYDIGLFPDRAQDAGVAALGHSGGVAMEDFDGDGLLDLMISSSGPEDQLLFFHNNGDGTFSDRTREAGLTGETGGLNIVAADYDNDGHPDLLILRGGWWGEHGKYPMSLLHNLGNGTFEDVTEHAALLSFHPRQTAAWADFDNDGWLDLYVGNESDAKNLHPSELFHNNHDGTFTEVAAPNHLSNMGFVKGVAWGDFNNDGRPDLYVSVKGGPNHLFRNDGPRDSRHPSAGRWQFTDVTAQAGVAEPLESFATWFFDYDNDGWPDIFVAGYGTQTPDDVAAFEIGKVHHAETSRLYHNNHDGTFTDVTKLVGLDRAILIMGAGFGDLDNDGWLDIYLGTGDSLYESLLPNKMFRNNAGKFFQDVTTSGGFGILQKGHGIAFGDLRNNGNEDVFAKIGGAYPGDTYKSVLFENLGHGNHWVTLELEGVHTNRSATGARIEITVMTAKGKRHIFRTVGYGSSFGGNPLRQHIGVGDATKILQVEVTWPVPKQVQQFRDVPLDRAFHIRQGSDVLSPLVYVKGSRLEQTTR